MSLLDKDTEVTARAHGVRRGRGIVLGIVWVVVGATLATLALTNPLHIGVLDGLRHRVLGVDGESGHQGEAHQLWTCSMHPQVVQDHPGNCPICGMPLVPLRRGQPGTTATAVAGGSHKPQQKRKILFYRNPMNPTVTSPVPMKDDMGMDYVPVYADEAAGTQSSGATVSIDPAVVQDMNVVTQVVKRGRLTREIRTVGYLEYDQQKMVSVTTKYPGWIEKVYVNYVGEPVRKGQPLFEIYSPELVQTEQDLLSAIAFSKRMAGATDDARQRSADLVQATRQRLAYWDISPDQVKRLEEDGKVFRTLTVAAPASGVVMLRMPGLDGMAVKPGMELFHIADLSSLWLSVEAFEDQLEWLKVGSDAQVNLSYFPGEAFTGHVRYIEPEVNDRSRTVRLMLALPNPSGRLRAGMYATVVFKPAVVEDAVLVPSAAVIRTGQRNLVVVAEGEGHFAPRDVKLGPQGNGQVAILSGLQAGETVVTSAQFLIDSESNLHEAMQKLIAHKAVPTASPQSQR